jgi:hypothetical protein
MDPNYPKIVNLNTVRSNFIHVPSQNYQNMIINKGMYANQPVARPQAMEQAMEQVTFVTPDIDLAKLGPDCQDLENNIGQKPPSVSKFHFGDRNGSSAKMIDVLDLSEGTMNKFGNDAGTVEFVGEFNGKNF